MRQLNLLPPHRRANLQRDIFVVAATRLLRGILYGLGVTIGLGVVLSIALWLLATAASRATEAEVAEQTRLYGKVRAEIAQNNTLLMSIHQIGMERIVWSRVLHDVLGTLPPGGQITTITANSEGESLALTGTAPTRSSLVVFEERLRVLPWVVEVVAPRSNLLLRDNPSFNFDIRVNPEKVAR